MPTVHTEGPFRFFFYSGDRPERPHIHVERDDRIAKFWLNPVEVASDGHFRAPDLKEARAIVDERENDFLEAWREHFRE